MLRDLKFFRILFIEAQVFHVIATGLKHIDDDFELIKKTLCAEFFVELRNTKYNVAVALAYFTVVFCLVISSRSTFNKLENVLIKQRRIVLVVMGIFREMFGIAMMCDPRRIYDLLGQESVDHRL